MKKGRRDDDGGGNDDDINNDGWCDIDFSVFHFSMAPCIYIQEICKNNSLTWNGFSVWIFK